MKNELRAYHCGRITFARFYAITRKEWFSLASSLIRRWRLPPSVDIEDVVQVMLADVHRRVPRWDPERGRSLEDFVVWNACDKAVKWLHRERCAFRRDGKSKSRYPLPFACLAIDGTAEQRLVEKASADVDETVEMHEQCERRETLALLAERAQESLQRYVLGVLARTGDLRQTVETVRRNSMLHLAFNIEPEHAERAVRRVLKATLSQSSESPLS